MIMIVFTSFMVIRVSWLYEFHGYTSFMVTRGSQLHRGSRLHRADFFSEQVGYRERPTKMPLIGSKAAADLGWPIEFPVLNSSYC